MSGLSSSVTFLLPHAEAMALVEEAKAKNWSAILPTHGDEDHFLYASSRNNHMEYALRALVAAFPCDGLSYLRRWDDVIDKGPWLTAIQGAELRDAVKGLGDLLAAMRTQPAKSSALIYQVSDSSLEQDVIEALAMPAPQSLADAKQLYQQNRFRDEGDDAASLVSFLYAHARVLEAASKRNVSAIYGLLLY